MKKFKIDKNTIVIELLDTIRIIVISFVIVFICTKFILRPVKVDGDSMYPTLQDDEFGFSYVLGALQEDFNRFDVVVANHRSDDSLWVKRIIALPGETIEYKEDKLYINGIYFEEAFLDEEYVKLRTNNHTSLFTNDFGPITLGDDEYFLMGDNRVVSHDSRSVGAFKKSDLTSKGVIVILPLNKAGIVNNGTK